MATVQSKTFDVQQGAVVIQVKDAVLGQTSVHTIYLLKPDGTANDVQALIDETLTQVDTYAVNLKSALTAAGWSSGS